MKLILCVSALSAWLCLSVCAVAQMPAPTDQVPDDPVPVQMGNLEDHLHNPLEHRQSLSEFMVENTSSFLARNYQLTKINIVVVLSDPTPRMLLYPSDPKYDYSAVLLEGWDIGKKANDRAGIVIVVFSDIRAPEISATPPFDTLIKNEDFGDKLVDEVSNYIVDRDYQMTTITTLNMVLGVIHDHPFVLSAKDALPPLK